MALFVKQTNKQTKNINYSSSKSKKGAIPVMPEWLSSGKGSFHLHIFLCSICLHDTTATFPSCTSYFLMSLFWFSIPNKILVLVRNFMLVSKNRKRTSFRMKNPNSCSLGRVAHAYLKSQKKNNNNKNASEWAVRFYHVNAVRISLRDKPLESYPCVI